jgi:hypothetical protein
MQTVKILVWLMNNGADHLRCQLAAKAVLAHVVMRLPQGADTLALLAIRDSITGVVGVK